MVHRHPKWQLANNQLMKNPDQLRHILKTISWRIVGTIDTMIVSYIVTGSLKVGMAIGGFEVFTKMILYYFHERVWYKYISVGRLRVSGLQVTRDPEPINPSTPIPSTSPLPPHIIPQTYTVTHTDRTNRNQHPPKVFWMTGLSGS